MYRQVKRQANCSNVDEEVESYNYNNTNDRENFCPAGGVSYIN